MIGAWADVVEGFVCQSATAFIRLNHSHCGHLELEQGSLYSKGDRLRLCDYLNVASNLPSR
jgi:hypothetical protein